MAVDNKLKLVDTTLRDGAQSLWGMMTSHHMSEPIMQEMGEVGYDTIDLSLNFAQMIISTRFFKEDPAETFRMWSEKLKGTKTNIMSAGMGASMGVSAAVENKTALKMYYGQLKKWVPQLNQILCICCTQDEIKNTFPVLFPMLRSLGMEPIPYMAIGHGPQHTPEFYAAKAKELVEKFQPISICFKDVDGLLVPERTRELIAAVQAVVGDTPLEFHMHGMNGLNTYNAVVAMEMGVRKFSSGIPPLANGAAHMSVFDIVKNAEALGIPHDIDVEKCKIVTERLTKIGEDYGHPVNNYHLPYDVSGYKHQIPGGVISNTVTQLAQLDMSDRLQDVLDEIPLILEDLGHPVMITPFSQFIVTQAVLNITMGRWEECLDPCVEFAAGIYGIEEAGVPYMNQELKKKLLSLPQAKGIIEKANGLMDYLNSEPSEAECKEKVGLTADATTEEYVERYVYRGDEELKNCTPGGPEFYRKYL
ncbi:MAG: hypothetical protein V7629_01790 [Motiliproteus sp.]